MGSLCSSCCGRRRKSAEKEPLLSSRIPNDLERPSKAQLDKVADILAALRAGNLPTQDQVNGAIQAALRSELLDVGSVGRVLGSNSSGLLSDTGMDESGRKVVEDVRHVLEAGLQIGLEKNDDNLIQDLIYHTRHLDTVPLHVDVQTNNQDLRTIASTLPTEPEAKFDFIQLLRSMRTLIRLLLTSSAFRVLLSDILTTVREIAADVAADIGQVASKVENTADLVEEMIRPEEPDLNGKAPNLSGSGDSVLLLDSLKTDPNKTTRDVTLDRLESIILQAHQNPEYQASLFTLLHLIQKYARRMEIASSALQHASETDSAASFPSITYDPSLSRALSDMKTLLERFASHRSLDPCLSLLSEFIYMVLTDPSPAARDYFRGIASYLEVALADPTYASSRQGRKEAESLYDRGRTLLSSSSPLANLLQRLLSEIDAFTNSLRIDRTTNLLITALSTFSADLASFACDSAQQGKDAPARLRSQAVRALLGWIFPRLMKVLRALPMPRFEMKSPMIDAAVDAMLLVADASFLPDHVHIANTSEIRLDAVEHEDTGFADDRVTAAVDPSVKGGRVASFTKTRIHIDGLRIGAHDVGYYVRYKGPAFIGYEDEGLVTLDVGGHGATGEGLLLDLELETEYDNYAESASTSTSIFGTQEQEERKLFKVTDVRVDLPGLNLHIDNSRHWILNKLLLQPLGGPIGRRVVEWIVSSQARGALEALEEWMRGVRGEAKRRVTERGESEPAWEDWWAAVIWSGKGEDQDQDQEEVDGGEDQDDDGEPETETHTTVTLKGIVRTSVPHPDESEAHTSHSTSQEETTLAIGLGPQILPGKAEPLELVPEVREALGPGQVARETLGEVQGAVDDVRERAEEGVRKAGDVRRDVEGATKRMEKRRRKEEKRGGWRSRAFDM